MQYTEIKTNNWLYVMINRKSHKFTKVMRVLFIFMNPMVQGLLMAGFIINRSSDNLPNYIGFGILCVTITHIATAILGWLIRKNFENSEQPQVVDYDKEEDRFSARQKKSPLVYIVMVITLVLMIGSTIGATFMIYNSNTVVRNRWIYSMIAAIIADFVVLEMCAILLLPLLACLSTRSRFFFAILTRIETYRRVRFISFA